MNVLIWVDKFPTFSETFIRDQITSLLDNGIKVLIYPRDRKTNSEALKALSGFESYALPDKVVDIDCYFKNNKVLRLLSFIMVFFLTIPSKNLSYYKEALYYKKYGAISKSLRLFFRVHFVLKHKIDVIHAHFGPNGNDAAILKAIGLPIKLFTTFHGYDIRLGIHKGGHLYSNLFKYADGLFSISEYNYTHLATFGAPKQKLIRLSNGIDTSFYKRDTIKFNEVKILVLSVGRLVEEKAFDMAIRAVSSIVKTKGIHIQYTIVGEGILRPKLEALITRLGMTESIQLVGYKTSKEVRDLMVQSDVFLLSSQVEALPTVLLEAQACGMVILATDVGSVTDIVKAGMVVTSKDIEAYKNGLLELIEKRDQWAIFAKEGRDFVCEFHELKQHSQKLIKAYGLSMVSF